MPTLYTTLFPRETTTWPTPMGADPDNTRTLTREQEFPTEDVEVPSPGGTAAPRTKTNRGTN